MDIVYLNGLRCECTIGVWAWEKQIQQTLVLDIEVAADIAKAAKSDNLDDALDYQSLTEKVQQYAADHQFDLIETLVERLAELILKEFPTNWVKIKLDKGQAVKGVKNVGVIIERSNG